MKRLIVEWTGEQIEGAAVNVLYFSDGSSGIAAAVRAAYAGLGQWLPLGVAVRVRASGDVIDPSNGDLTDVWSEGLDPTPTGGSGPTSAAAGVGACVNWTTAGIVNARRVRGRTFIVPLATVAYDGSGTLAAGCIDDLEDFGLAMVAAGLVVWHRPTTPLGTDGSEHPAVAAVIRDRVAYLSSRRD